MRIYKKQVSALSCSFLDEEFEEFLFVTVDLNGVLFFFLSIDDLLFAKREGYDTQTLQRTNYVDY